MKYALALLAVALLTGCAVGRNEGTVAIVLGFEAGKLVETPGQALGVAADFLPEPFRSLAVGALGIGGTALATSRATRKRDAAFDEGVARATGHAPPPVHPVSQTRGIMPGGGA